MGSNTSSITTTNAMTNAMHERPRMAGYAPLALLVHTKFLCAFIDFLHLEIDFIIANSSEPAVKLYAKKTTDCHEKPLPAVRSKIWRRNTDYDFSDYLVILWLHEIIRTLPDFTPFLSETGRINRKYFEEMHNAIRCAILEKHFEVMSISVHNRLEEILFCFNQSPLFPDSI